MPSPTQLDYRLWRRRALPAARLREGARQPPAERLLQVIWQHQRLKGGTLRLADGRPLRVLHPGFWGGGAGPDFRGAVVRFGREAAVSGDVEIDVVPGGWRAHGHHHNPAFAGTILRVVWDTSATNGVPLFALKPHLDAPWDELETWAGCEPLGDLPAKLRGACCAPLQQTSSAGIQAILRQAALVRLEHKAERLRARARDCGWVQALWEGLFAGLGFQPNQWPMRRLAEALPALRGHVGCGRAPAVCWQAVLLGAGGLLPAELPSGEDGRSRHLRELWDAWWRLREELADLALPRAMWRFAGVRPANRPERRLALAAQWLADDDFMPRLEAWFHAAQPGARPVAALAKLLAGGRDAFWESHWTFSTRQLTRPAPLIGGDRVADLAINVLLPWLWARAATGRNEAARARVESLYFAWPKSADNSVLKLARQRLLGTTSARTLASAAAQQGLLQIVRDFCAHTDALCTDCPFPDYARGFAAGAAGVNASSHGNACRLG